MPKRKLQMRFRIEHELKGRMRLHVCTKKMSYEEADTLQYYLGSFPFVTKVKVHENIGNVTVNYVGSRKRLCVYGRYEIIFAGAGPYCDNSDKGW